MRQSAAGEPFQGFDVQDLAILGDHIDWVKVPARLCSEKRYVVQVARRFHGPDHSERATILSVNTTGTASRAGIS
ncbi:MAG: hypothetical protein U5K27_14405 [Desulfotignum sp.]|nr:hypothetical protein [Desulfotignum sp.]